MNAWARAQAQVWAHASGLALCNFIKRILLLMINIIISFYLLGVHFRIFSPGRHITKHTHTDSTQLTLRKKIHIQQKSVLQYSAAKGMSFWVFKTVKFKYSWWLRSHCVNFNYPICHLIKCGLFVPRSIRSRNELVLSVLFNMKPGVDGSLAWTEYNFSRSFDCNSHFQAWNIFTMRYLLFLYYNILCCYTVRWSFSFGWWCFLLFDQIEMAFIWKGAGVNGANVYSVYQTSQKY